MKINEMKCFVGVVCMAVFLLIFSSSWAIDINVLNYSFENPDLSPDGAQAGIIDWGINGPAAGIAHNGWNGGAIDLANSDGEQIAWMNAYANAANELASSGIWQVLADTYTVGQTYDLTVGVARAFWNPTGDEDQLDIRFFYDGGGVVVLASTTVTAGDLNWSNGGDLIDYTVTLPEVLATDDWAGKAIGIWIVASSNPSNAGDWVVDNVRLTIADTASNPDPSNGQTLVDIGAVLSWEPPAAFAPVGYDVYIGTDPNVAGVSELGWASTSISPATDLGYPLTHEMTYYWRVDALEPNSPSPIVHVGDVWSFTTAPPVPVVTVNPDSQTVTAGTIIDLSVTALNTDTYTWYHSADAIADAGDTVIATGQAIQVTINGVSDEGWYYCVAANTIDSDTSEMARIMTERLVGFWDFEGDLADNVADAPAHDGIATDPNFVEGVPGLGEQGYQFFGDGRIITIADSNDYFNFYPQGLTVSCWVKGQDVAIWDTVCSKEYERELGYLGAKGFYLGRSSGGAAAFAIRPAETVGGSFAVDDWHQLVGVHDPADGVIRVYLDGVLNAEVTANPASFNAPNLAPLIFGAESTDGTIGASSATIDDVKIYNYALDSTEIAQQYVDIAGGYICIGGNPAADLSGDCQVNLEDLQLLAEGWLESNRIE